MHIYTLQKMYINLHIMDTGRQYANPCLAINCISDGLLASGYNVTALMVSHLPYSQLRNLLTTISSKWSLYFLHGW